MGDRITVLIVEDDPIIAADLTYFMKDFGYSPFPAVASAEQALLQGKSLLSVGVTAVHGQFERGDAITVCNANGRALAHGLIGYDSDEAFALIGRQSDEFETVLGYRGRKELVHRDNLVLLVEK